MDKLEILKESVDAWIKKINTQLAELNTTPKLINENTDNIQHNYELIYELKDKLEELEQEINALKLIQIITLKQRLNNETLASGRKEIH